ncbi:MAG: hydrogenase maturation protease [Anaerolineae bacterium]
MTASMAARPARRNGEGSSVVSPAPLQDTLILGLGNPMRGDDGIGVRVIEKLAVHALPQGVEAAEGGTKGLGLVNLMEGWRRVILVDAANVGLAPGEFARFTRQEARLLGDDQRLSVHNAGLREALLLAEVLELLPEEIVIYGVQPAKLDWHAQLSPEVEAAVPGLVRSILGELDADTRVVSTSSADSNTLTNEQEEGNDGE